MIRHKLIKILFFLLILILPGIPFTNSSFTAQSTITGNVVSAGFWETEAPTKDPRLFLTLSKNKKSVSFTVTNIKEFVRLSFELTYDTNSAPQGVVGESDLDGQDSFSQKDIILGTCSSEDCVYQKGARNFNLKVTLQDSNGQTVSLEQMVIK